MKSSNLYLHLHGNTSVSDLNTKEWSLSGAIQMSFCTDQTKLASEFKENINLLESILESELKCVNWALLTKADETGTIGHFALNAVRRSDNDGSDYLSEKIYATFLELWQHRSKNIHIHLDGIENIFEYLDRLSKIPFEVGYDPSFEESEDCNNLRNLLHSLDYQYHGVLTLDCDGDKNVFMNEFYHTIDVLKKGCLSGSNKLDWLLRLSRDEEPGQLIGYFAVYSPGGNATPDEAFEQYLRALWPGRVVTVEAVGGGFSDSPVALLGAPFDLGNDLMVSDGLLAGWR
jgi:hypothetical protein